MSYEFYKVLHFICIFITISAIGIHFYLPQFNKKLAIGTKISSVFILISGMGLLAKIGGKWEPWVITKITIWFILMASSAVFLKKMREKKATLFPFTLVLFIIAATSAVLKF